MRYVPISGGSSNYSVFPFSPLRPDNKILIVNFNTLLYQDTDCSYSQGLFHIHTSSNLILQGTTRSLAMKSVPILGQQAANPHLPSSLLSFLLHTLFLVWIEVCLVVSFYIYGTILCKLFLILDAHEYNVTHFYL